MKKMNKVVVEEMFVKGGHLMVSTEVIRELKRKGFRTAKLEDLGIREIGKKKVIRSKE
mgnify:CR=1 FL=1